jgi:acetyl-CoA synthetase
MGVNLSVEDLCETGVPVGVAKDIRKLLINLPAHDNPAETWRDVSHNILSPDMPFSLHRLLYDTIYKEWDHAQGPPPSWLPTKEEIDASNIASFCTRVGTSVGELHQWSVENREDFWGAIIETLDIPFETKPDAILDTSRGVEFPRWLAGARLNIAESCFVAAGNTPAILYQAHGGSLQTMTYDELDRLSNQVANGLVEAGFEGGDAIAIAMPMTAESVIAYLGIVKAGCAVVSIADSFAPEEIATRLRIADARAIVTQDVLARAGKTLPMYDKVVEAGAKRAIVIPAGDSMALPLRAEDLAWADFLSKKDTFNTVTCDPDDTSNVLFSSGTTGDPKAIPWTHSTPIKCAMDGHLHHNIKHGDVVAWPTNLGWMMGPWLIYASLINRGTIALYYDTPGTADFCRFVQDAGVHMLGLVPSIVKAWRASGAANGVDWNHIRVFSSTGEPSNPDDYLYLTSLAGYRPVIEYCGGTEIGGGYVCGTVVQPASPSTFTTPAFGLDLIILDDKEQPVDEGELFLIPPSIGLSIHLLNKDHHEVYYKDTPKGPNGELLRRHGDEVLRLPGNYYRAQGRADDTMNLGGIKVSAAEIERTVSAVGGVVETAAIAVAQTGGGPSQLVIYVVSDSGIEFSKEELRKNMQHAIAKNLNPLFKISDVIPIDALPRTASNKVMRRVLRDRYQMSDL